MAKQMRVSPSDGEIQLIEAIAKAWRRSEGDVLLDGFRRGFQSLVRDYETYLLHTNGTPEMQQGDNILGLAIKRLAAGEAINSIELEVIARHTGIDLATLEQIRNCLASQS